MTPPPADLGNFAAGSLGEASRSAHFIHGSLNRGLGSLGGSQGTETTHNFSNENADGDRIVLVGIGGGIAVPFIHFPIFHNGDL